mmetsp:Transcript_14786/g.33636  ORF Transcript_14786/g.33636 Transcript_14786/m.33636 type:complete len:242 (+) Transcript_14786:88-813(+)
MLRTNCIAAAVLLALVGATNEAGQKFLDAVSQKPDVVKLPSGLMYKVVRHGSGHFHPTLNSPCECHYAGTTPVLTKDPDSKTEAQWKVFDSSYKRGQPTTFAPHQVIKAWTEAMQLMVEGDKWEMYIPSELGYGEKGAGEKIKPGDALVFRMEILKIKGEKKEADRCDFETLEGCTERQKKFILKQRDSKDKQVLHDSLSDELKKTLEAHPEGKDEPKNWLLDRVKILKKLIAKESRGSEL